MHPGKTAVLACIALAGAALAPGSGPVPGAGVPLAAPVVVRQVRLRPVDLSGPLPEDLRSPEGKTRWDLAGLRLGQAFTRSLADTDDGIAIVDQTETGHGDRVYTGDGARAWLFPDRFPDLMKMGGRADLDLRDEGDGRADDMHVEVETIGIGWVHLPSGPREAVLQRARVFRGRAEGRGDPRGIAPERLIHRWVDPRAGIVAEVSRPAVGGGAGAAGAGMGAAGGAGAAGEGQGGITAAVVLEQVLAGAATLKIYVEELDTPPFSGIAYGWDRGAGTTIASITPQAYATMGDLIAADSWDFSGLTTGVSENASTGVALTAAETCNISQCGYNSGGAYPNRVLNREDKNFDTPADLRKTNAVTEREQRASDVVVWLRGGAQNEGVSGGLGTGESRFCYASDDGVTRTPVPIWRFPNQDGPGFYMQPGDPAWVGGPFNCEQNIFNAVCGAGGIVPRIWSKACTGTSGTHAGTQSGQILKGGVVTLPSGHTYNALLVRTVADFCVYIASGCAALWKADEVRTFVYLWQVPTIGTVARLTSAQNELDGTSFTTLAETDIKFGLFPPLSITATGSTDTSVSLAWDPGRDTRRISGYKVYWGTASGGGTPYPFSSASHPAQVAFAGTAATISELSPGTTYYFTVTSLSSFTDPSAGVATTYESLLYPTQVSGDPSSVYPVEVQAATTGGTCVPAAEVTGLTVEHDAPGIRICWAAASDPCLIGYRVLGAASPEAAANFSALADTGTETCWSGDPAAGYFLVVARGTGGAGPWGHYGQ